MTPDRSRLFRIASRQAGCFTRAQAEESGFDTAPLAALEKDGTIARAQPGVYRFVRYPAPWYAEIMAAWLAAGADGAVVSHETALRLWELLPRPPRQIHLTLPRTARAPRRALRGVVIHTARRKWREGEVAHLAGMAVTAPARAVVDAAEAGLGQEEVSGMIRAALAAGLVTAQALAEASRGRAAKVKTAIRRAIRGAGE